MRWWERAARYVQRSLLKRYGRKPLSESPLSSDKAEPPTPASTPAKAVTASASDQYGPVRVLSVEPPVFLSGLAYDDYLGFAPAFAERHPTNRAAFIIFPTWTIESDRRAGKIARAYRLHTRTFRHQDISYICNTIGEARLLRERGVPAEFLNHKFTVSEDIFKPLPAQDVDFDAVYNARFILSKRHDLTVELDNVAYITYLGGKADTEVEEFRRVWAETSSRSPRHVLVNEIDARGLPVRMPHTEVNAVLAQAHVGLVLSAAEGASYAAMEYMLAGLPVVSTPSIGGRDVFFDPEYCIVCEPTALAVRDATRELIRRQIPRDYIRARTLDKIAPGRERLLRMVDERGGASAPGRTWPYADLSGVPWDTYDNHLGQYEKVRTKHILAQLQQAVGPLHGVQLTPAELRPIVEQVQARPNCRFLVFGCGNDSQMWEAVNANGTTVFLEEDEDWATEVRGFIKNSSVHVVRYASKVSDWKDLLDRPDRLALDLPNDVTSEPWDVILVDAPAGYADDRSGRMKSIFMAARLVAPHGVVFVHDCERPVEAAYASRYLGDDNLFVEVKGHALLRGYTVSRREGND